MTANVSAAGAGAASRLREQAAPARRLRKLARVFDVPDVLRQALPAAQVAACYEHCHDAHRKYHSAEGAVHMALDDGDRFDPDGFYRPLRRIEVLPGLRRLERTTGAVIRFAWLGRRALARRHPARGRNVLAGYLMRSTVEMGLIGYREIVLVRPR